MHCAHLVISSDIKVLTLAQNSFDPVSTPNNAIIEKVNVTVDKTLVRT